MRYCYNWRKQTEKLQAAAKILSNPDLLEMLATLELDHPSRQPLSVPDGMQGMKMLGEIEGYQRCLDMLRSLGTPIQTVERKEVESKFGAKEKGE